MKRLGTCVERSFIPWMTRVCISRWAKEVDASACCRNLCPSFGVAATTISSISVVRRESAGSGPVSVDKWLNSPPRVGEGRRLRMKRSMRLCVCFIVVFVEQWGYRLNNCFTWSRHCSISHFGVEVAPQMPMESVALCALVAKKRSSISEGSSIMYEFGLTR